MSTETQRKEFDAADELVKQLRRLNMTAIVDDDYPDVRYDYESALAGLVAAMGDNGRFEPGNRYKLARATPAPVDHAANAFALLAAVMKMSDSAEKLGAARCISGVAALNTMQVSLQKNGHRFAQVYKAYLDDKR